MRPEFPSNVPPQYAVLAQRCWVRNAAERPRFSEVVHAVRQLLQDGVHSEGQRGALREPQGPSTQPEGGVRP